MKALPVIATIVLAAGSVACTRSPAPAPESPTSLRDGESPDAAESGVVPDRSIVRVLIHELNSDPAVARERIRVDSEDGVVTMQGRTSSRLAKDRAVAIAQVVRGVRAIIDRVSVTPNPHPDAELEFAVAGALASDMLTANQRLGVHAHNGVLRLSGDVDSDAARRIVESDVLAIPGVLDLVDDLAVVPCQRSDRQLAGEAERTVRDDPWLDDARVGVSASDGSVTLDGVVRSATERARAEADARTTSPVAVDVTKLRIDGWNDDGTLRGRPPVRRSDGDLVQALAGAYARDPRVRPMIPTIDVHEGVVVLTGVAANAEAARAAREDARDLPGVVEVREHLKPIAAVVENDRVVLKDVREAIDRDPRLGPRRLEVDVVGGRVYLRGHVASAADRWHAVAVTTSVLGARDVHNGLLVDPPRLAHPPGEPGTAFEGAGVGPR